MTPKRIIIIGSTGSLGTQTLDIIRQHRGLFTVLGLAAGRNATLLREQIEEFQPKYFYSLEPGYLSVASLEEMVSRETCDLLVAVSSGVESHEAIRYCLHNRIPVALGNKEIIVSYGDEIVNATGGAPCLMETPAILPIDSEHSALFQCLRGENIHDVRRVMLTASGGALRNVLPEHLSHVTPDDVLSHPTWKMGKKVTVDSATLVNKAFEVIEAHYLFGIPYEKIEVRLHPESLVHAIVEFKDGSCKATAFNPDMRIPIAHALHYPSRASYDFPGCNFVSSMHFSLLHEGQFPCFDIVLSTAKKNPELLPKIVDADERAVRQFLDGKILFTEIFNQLRACVPMQS